VLQQAGEDALASLRVHILRWFDYTRKEDSVRRRKSRSRQYDELSDLIYREEVGDWKYRLMMGRRAFW